MNKKRNVGIDAHIDQSKGITLIALVVTIIILLILAGVTINLTIGQNGILNKAKEASRDYKEAAKRENEEMANFLKEEANIIAGIGTSSEPPYTMVDGVPVPKGFKHTEGTKDTGFVIKDVSETATKGNEYVWIPCSEDEQEGSIKYDRYNFSSDGWYFSQDKTGEAITMNVYGTIVSFTEAKQSIEIEINSIKKYGGFYIGRYEVGIVDGEEDLTGYDRSSFTAPDKEWTGYTGGTAVVQKEQQVWNYITKDKAKKVAEGMYANNSAVVSRLCSSYAWDTTLQFIGGDYAVDSMGDNYSGNLKATGMNCTPRKGIYDMGGNVSEWTTEVCEDEISPNTKRGGNYNSLMTMEPASFRFNTAKAYAFNDTGFRSTLYVQ